MRPVARAVLGAVLGGVLALILHPVSRPYFRPVMGPSPVLSDSNWVQGSGRPLVNLDSPTGAAYSLILATESDPKDSHGQWLQIAQQWGSREPANAFWPQMEAVFAHAVGDEAASDAAWVRASRCDRWDDHQAGRLLRVRDELEASSGTSMAWHRVTSFALDSTAPAAAIYDEGMRRAAASPLVDADADFKRYGILKNGTLLRDAARTNAAFATGIRLIELSARPRVLASEKSQRSLLLGRFDLINRLRAEGRNLEADAADAAFRSNTGWGAMLRYASAERKRESLEMPAQIFAALPSAFLAGAVIATLVAWIGMLLRPRIRSIHRVRPLYSCAIGLIIGAAVYAATVSISPALACGGAIALLGAKPRAIRSQDTAQFGPLHGILCGLIGAAIAVAWLAYWVSVSSGAQTVRAVTVDPPVSIFEPPSNLMVLMSSIGLLLLLAPMWTWALRIPALRVLNETLIRSARQLAWGFGLAAVLAGPVCIAVDKRIGTRLDDITENEPTFYYNDWTR